MHFLTPWRFMGILLSVSAELEKAELPDIRVAD